MSSQRFVQSPWLTDDITTSNATPTVSTATSYAVPSNASGRVEVRYVAKDGSQNTISGVVSQKFKNIAGTLTLVGSLVSLEALAGDAALLTALVGVTSSGTTVQPQLTGIAATNIEWLLDVRYWVH